MKNPLLLFGISAFLLSCATVRALSEPTPVGSWRNPGSEYASILMHFEPGGGLNFQDGFEFWNPSKWSLSEDGLLITLGGDAPFVDATAYQLQHRPGSLKRFDEKSRTLLYPFAYCTTRIDFQGFIFFREPPAGCQGQ